MAKNFEKLGTNCCVQYLGTDSAETNSHNSSSSVPSHGPPENAFPPLLFMGGSLTTATVHRRACSKCSVLDDGIECLAVAVYQ
jgi:hypothetical protein